MQNEPHEVILTHEHTDFDALASLLGASLLFPHALPVLPYKLNGNVSNFLALYKNQFPFLSSRDLPKQTVDRVIFVDTRKANHPRGIQDDTQFYIIDHHSFKQELPENWQIWTEPVGANTTLLVEKLIEQNQHLSPVQATLLALGIYEDTGSLTYASTTYRDAACLAWLLQPEHAVNLEVVRRFLNHPLNDDQRALLQALVDGSEFIEKDGHTIVIARADAEDFEGEISTLAHRLVDFHEQDATFLVINLGDIVQVVARSSTNAVDVGLIAQSLGGGGHPRAAAAHVHDASTGEVRDQIKELLDVHVHSAMMVRHIMSLGIPKAVSPEMTVSEAAELMGRYGHEGFPVIEAKPDETAQIIGVLTRREIDRSINHNMGTLTVKRVMQAGTVSVHPTDSISTLRQRMIESGWGQIPVVNDDDRIIGIVTRTDLIKLWDESRFSEERKSEMDQQLRRGLTPTQYALLRWIGTEIDAMNFTAYIVGGYVRDLLLNQRRRSSASFDVDCVVEGDAIAFAQRLQSLYGGRVIPHKRFGTAKWLLTDSEYPVNLARFREKLGEKIVSADLPQHLDFVSARTEFYTAPSALPTVERSSIKLDLLRRDFSINTLAICLSSDRWGDLLDLFGGMHDLEQGVIQVLHSLSFVDDPTRILRAVRYEQRFGFQIAPRTLELLQNALDLIERVSPVRVRHELERILQEETPEEILLRLDELGILKAIHPALKADEQVKARLVRVRQALGQETNQLLESQPVELLYWGAWVQDLSADVHAELAERLRLQSRSINLMDGLRKLQAQQEVLTRGNIKPSEVVAVLDQVAPLAIALYCAVNELPPQFHTTVQRYLDEWQEVKPQLDGYDLKEMGIPRGPLYAQILSQLRAARLNGEVTSRAEEELMAKKIAAI